MLIVKSSSDSFLSSSNSEHRFLIPYIIKATNTSWYIFGSSHEVFSSSSQWIRSTLAVMDSSSESPSASLETEEESVMAWSSPSPPPLLPLPLLDSDNSSSLVLPGLAKMSSWRLLVWFLGLNLLGLEEVEEEVESIVAILDDNHQHQEIQCKKCREEGVPKWWWILARGLLLRQVVLDNQPTNHSFIHSSMLSSYSRVSIDFFVYGENDEKEGRWQRQEVGFVPVSLLCCST